MRYDAEHKQKTRDRVLDEAARAIRAEGPHRMGVAQVMAGAGLTHGGFYAHFPSKEALVEAAIGRMFEQSRARLARETGGRTPAEGLAAYVDFYLSAAHRDARSTGCVLAALATELPRLTPEVRAAFAAGAERLRVALAGLMAGAGRDAPEDLAASVVAELVGALSLARAEPDPARSDLILARSKRLLKQRLSLEGGA